MSVLLSATNQSRPATHKSDVVLYAYHNEKDLPITYLPAQPAVFGSRLPHKDRLLNPKHEQTLVLGRLGDYIAYERGNALVLNSPIVMCVFFEVMNMT